MKVRVPEGNRANWKQSNPSNDSRHGGFNSNLRCSTEFLMYPMSNGLCLETKWLC